MKPIQYPLGVSPRVIAELHAFYCQKTRMGYSLDKRIERQWAALLAVRTVEEIKLVAGYLAWRVDKEKRLPGCLKLNGDNFFHPEKFADDLAEARRIKARVKPRPTAAQMAMSELRPGVAPRPTASADAGPVSEQTRRFLDELQARRERRKE